MNGFGGGFGGNLGGFQLPDFSGIDLEGIAAQVAKYTAEQDLANATNEYEKDAAETKLNQVKEYESGIAELPPIAEQVMQQLLPENGGREPGERDIDIRDPVGTSSIVEPYQEPYVQPELEFDLFYDDGYEDYVDYEPVDPIYEEPIYEEPIYEEPVYEEPVYVAPEPIDSLPEMPGIELPETPFPPVVLPEPPPPTAIYGREDPAAQTGSEALFDRGYVQSNPAISNLIQQQRAAYGDALKRAVYKAPDRVQDDYVRPMSAAEFGSVPGRYTPPTGPRPYVDDPEFTTMKQDPALLPVAMNHGGALNLNSSSMNRGIGQLPPMQQNDKLTQLFAQSFNPRR
jgi:hypothetical protein